MQCLQDNVRQDIITLVPSSIVNDISCFVFYDNHPRDEKNLDIIIGTVHGEVKEFYQRQVVCSTFLDISSTATDIIIIRNSKCELFYLVAVESDLYILSRREKLLVHKRITNVDTYEVSDTACRGQACLKIICRDDGVPLMFDDNFESLADQVLLLNQVTAYDCMPLVSDLKRKLVEAKYDVKCNEKSYKDLLSLRQSSAFTSYQQINSNFSDAFYNTPCQVEGALKIKTDRPWVKACNRKIVIVVEVLNNHIKPLEDVHILLHRTVKSSIVYTTKLFEPTPTPPYWRQKQSHHIKNNCKTAVVAVIDMKELKNSVTNKTEFNSVISYKNQGKEYLLPLENVAISAAETMGEQFDVLSDIDSENERSILLALLCTTEKTDISLRPIVDATETSLDATDIFCNHLKMELLTNTNDVIIHKKSPFHTLHGVMVVLHHNNKSTGGSFVVSLHTRLPSQVPALIYYIHDAVPFRVVVTTVDQKITAKTTDLSCYNEDTVSATPNPNYTEYGTSILKQTATTLEYLDKCMIKMNESKNPVIQSKVGSEIDVFACDVPSYLEFRSKMLEEAYKGIQHFETNATLFDISSQGDVRS